MNRLRQFLLITMGFFLFLLLVIVNAPQPAVTQDMLFDELSEEVDEPKEEVNAYYAVHLDGVFLGRTQCPKVVSRHLEDYLAFQSPGSKTAAFPEESLDFTLQRTSDVPVLTPLNQLLARMESRTTLMTVGTVLYIDDERVAVVNDRSVAEDVVQDIQNDYIAQREAGGDAEVESVEIKESIEFKQEKVDIEAIEDPKDVRAVLEAGRVKEIRHEVQPGETAWDIAQVAGVQTDDLEEANPGHSDLDRLQPGEEISLVAPEPYITFVTKEIHQYIRQTPFPVERQEDSSLWPWEQTIEQHGQRGEVKVIERRTLEEGREVDREILEEEKLAQPVTQIVRVGTRETPQQGSGPFILPTDGRLTSPFGPRPGGFHSGIDLAAASGTAVVAADAGTVTYVGWRGGYGRTIIIDHGGEHRTLYAHLNRADVEVGATVAQGDRIGTVGSTGVSTGPHLHFEIWVEGTPVDPMQFFE